MFKTVQKTCLEFVAETLNNLPWIAEDEKRAHNQTLQFSGNKGHKGQKKVKEQRIDDYCYGGHQRWDLSATLLHRVPPTTLKDRTINICMLHVLLRGCLIFLDQSKIRLLGID